MNNSNNTNNSCAIKPDLSRLEKLKEKFKDIPEKYFNDIEKKMDLVKLSQVSEQRCRSFGCKLEVCLYSAKDPAKCGKLFRELNYCVDLEKKDIIDTYIKTNKQVSH